jgi:hypothetical protein
MRVVRLTLDPADDPTHCHDFLRCVQRCGAIYLQVTRTALERPPFGLMSGPCRTCPQRVADALRQRP